MNENDRSTAATAKGRSPDPEMPSDITGDLGFFDRFATAMSRFVSRGPFFAFCVLLVLVWAPSILIFKSVDTWQLIINTATTIITFLMVAVLQNSQFRSDLSTQHKLNAIADALGDLMDHVAAESRHEHHATDLIQDVQELRAAVGLEDRETSRAHAGD